ncbi:hypothetical protein OUZ56_014977 [Daphnia magna]|uniref:Uncharacterized protein n=1 Tax=Daphnia magna TaxID=35525 RepID=A0ABR0ALN4_9CRUS|nr:hypothetical protein OUZ56_014977 [Daphnia magna]
MTERDPRTDSQTAGQRFAAIDSSVFPSSFLLPSSFLFPISLVYPLQSSLPIHTKQSTSSVRHTFFYLANSSKPEQHSTQLRFAKGRVT